MWPLALLFGTLVGFSLGLTGGGGSIFAVPLLVYGLAISPRAAVSMSLASVGVTSAVGFVERWRRGQVEVRTGLLFAVAGMFGAPVGSWLSHQMSEALLLTLFALVMLLVAGRMWFQKTAMPSDVSGPTCRRDPSGRLVLTSRCAKLLAVAGVITGMLSGLFGVGGGFVIVPALVMASGLDMQHAIGTSLLVISLISVSGVATHFASGQTLDLSVLLPFVAGGVVGLWLGTAVGRHLPESVLRKVFAVAIVAVAIFILVKAGV